MRGSLRVWSGLGCCLVMGEVSSKRVISYCMVQGYFLSRKTISQSAVCQSA